jgi:HK97 family phage prohead protease
VASPGSIVKQIRERGARLQARLRPGLAPRSYRNLAWAVGKDRLAYADPQSRLLISDGKPQTDDAAMAATFVVSTIDEDRDGDVVVPQGVRLDNYAKNPVWFFGHQQWEVPIGTAMDRTGQLRVSIDPAKIIATCFFDQEDPDAAWLYGKVSRGILRATSIGFIPLKAVRHEPVGKARSVQQPDRQLMGWRFEEVDLVEISLVGVPANADAIRLALDRDRLSPRLRKALEPYATQCKAWSPGIGAGGANMAKTKRTRRKMSADEVVQAIILSKARFASLDDAKAYAESNGYSTDNIEETDDAFVVHQFPADELVPGTEREEQVEDGVTLRWGQREAAESEPAQSEMAQEETEGQKQAEDDDDGDGDEQQKQEDEQQPKQDDSQLPLGAQIIRGLLDRLAECDEYLTKMLPMLEHDKLKGFLSRKFTTACANLKQSLVDLAASEYPDLDLGADADAESMSDAGSDEADEDIEDEQPKRAHGAVTKRLSKAAKNTVQEAAEYMDDLSSAQDVPKRHRAGLKYHARALTDMLAQTDGGADAAAGPEQEDEEAKALLAAVRPLAQRMAGVERTLYGLTGRKV